ncbi:hypothetical protein PMAYCL1PPCAC_14993, partial [Pristionchus mayeri]
DSKTPTDPNLTQRCFPTSSRTSPSDSALRWPVSSSTSRVFPLMTYACPMPSGPHSNPRLHSVSCPFSKWTGNPFRSRSPSTAISPNNLDSLVTLPSRQRG